MRVLVVNAGSSTLKLRVLEADDRVAASADVRPSRDDVEPVLRTFVAVDAVGHRVVHGGHEFQRPVRIGRDVETRLRALCDLAPLHQPAALEMIDLVRRVLPDRPAVACFDTAFHATLPPAASTYPLPVEWRRRWGIRRFGFHGLSHAYVSRKVAQTLGREDLRIVSCHLGAGASLAAVKAGRSCDTTMGFTPLDGLVMATRPGSLDPGLVLWLQQHAQLSARDMEETLEHRAGLGALAGTADMREVIERARRKDPDASLALDVYVHRLRAGVAAMAAAMGGIDVLVFTGGVGENAPEVRRRAAVGLGFLGVGVDEQRNAAAGDRDITGDEAPVRAWVITSREDLEIARQVRETLSRE